MRRPTVSVAMATYNGQRFVQQQLQSIHSQTYPVDEIVVSDDGSTDGTVAEVLKGQHERLPIRLLPSASDPLGPSGNFQRALRASTGDVIILADQDDLWAPTRVGAALEALDGPGAPALVVHDASLINADGVRTGSSQFEKMGLSGNELAQLNSSLALNALVRRNVLPGMSMAIKRDLLDQALPVTIDWPHDYWLACIAGATGKLRVVRDSCHLSYRQHDSNVVGARSTLPRRIVRSLREPLDHHMSAANFSCLASRLADLGHPDASRIAMEKSQFEAQRGSLPRALPRRAREIARTGVRPYVELAANGRLDLARDLLSRHTTGRNAK